MGILYGYNLTARDVTHVQVICRSYDEFLFFGRRSYYLERFAFLNREEAKKLQDMLNVVKYAEKTERSKVPRGAQVSAAIH